MRRIAFIFLLAFFAISLLSCNTAERECVGIRSDRFSLFFEGVGDGIALADGEEYREGDLLPVFKRLSDILSVDLCEGDDIIFADLDALSARAERGELLNLSDYLHLMPHLSAYLAANPLVWLSLVEDGSGALYTPPYLSESAYLLPRFNADALRALLDGEGSFEFDGGADITDFSYTPYMKSEGRVTVDIILDGEPSSLTKSYATVGNIIELMNYRIDRGALSACDAVNMLRTYIDEAYGGFYGTARSDLFLGEAAAWDADELVALLRCARALGGEYSGLFVPDTDSLLGLSGILFSARGLLAEDFIGFDGSCAYDAAVSPETYAALLKMRAIIDEGLITVEREGAVASIGADGEEVLPPVVICDGEYTRLLPVSEKIAGFGAAVSAELAGSEKRLSAALGFLDYLFSDGARPLLCYGTDAFFSVTGRDFSPTEAALADAERYAGGDYNLYKYNYVGAGVLLPYGDISAERRGLIDTALSLGVAERVGRITDDGVYFPPSPISALSDTDERMLSENGYAEELSAVLSSILDGTLPIGTPPDIEALISSFKSSPDREEYLTLVTREYEIRLRIYKAILK